MGWHLPRQWPLYLAAAMLLGVALDSPLAAADVLGKLCGGSFYAANSAFQANVQRLAATLPRNASSSQAFFATAAIGRIPNMVHALLHCRGDISAAACNACATGAFEDAQQLCIYNKDATVFYDSCVLRYSDQDFILSSDVIGFDDDILRAVVKRRGSASASYDIAAGFLLNATANYAATRSPTLFATGVLMQHGGGQIFGLVQCTPDLAPVDCQKCLSFALDYGFNHCIELGGARGCIFSLLRCGFVYDQSGFFSGSPLVQLPAASDRHKGKTGRVLAITLPIIGAGVLAGLLLCCLLWRGRTRKTAQPQGGSAMVMADLFDPEDIKVVESLYIDLQTLRDATGDFDLQNKLGEGGFGTVYKGTLPDNQCVAVKRLSPSSGQGVDEFKAELLLLAKLRHRNLVRIVGVCFEEQETLIVYEYLPNKSLDHHIYDAEKRAKLDVFMIINGIARGIQYLHEDSHARIVHRDLKDTNVLLDGDLKPQISDFGLARVCGGDRSYAVTERRAGTHGYMSPEYAMAGCYSSKSDVYSFGVLLLEIITGKRNAAPYLLTLVWWHWTKGTILDIVDSSSSSVDKIIRCIQIGLLCVQTDPAARPTMSTVNIMLNSTSTLGDPSKPLMADKAPDAPETSASAPRRILSQIKELEEQFFSESTVADKECLAKTFHLTSTEV